MELGNIQYELADFIAEMNELIDKGLLIIPFDYENWLKEISTECKYCYQEVTEIAGIYIFHL